LYWTEGESMKKRQQGDDENKKEEMVMTTLKRRATDAPLRIQVKIQKFRIVDKSREKQSHIDTWRCRKKATKNYKRW
jgi:hypothetical protein